MVLLLHNKIRKGGLSILFIFFLLNNTSAQAKFTSICSSNRIGLDDQIQVQFKVENAHSVNYIDPPPFKNFIVQNGPNQESGMSSINGNISRYVSISFILKPQKSGTFILPPAVAIVDGKQIKSNPITIRVENKSTVAGKAAPPASPFSSLGMPDITPEVHPVDDYVLKPGEDPNEKIKKNLFLKLDASKTKCYVGEPIIVSFKLYTRLRSETNITDAPAFNGFSVSDLDVDENATEEKINGKTYNCYVLRKVQLYPMQAGTFRLSPLHASNTVSFLKYNRHAFQGGDLLMQMMQDFGGNGLGPSDMIDKQINLQSNDVTIEVKPLPKENIPGWFKGAVGNFGIQSNLSKDNFSTDDAGNLAITISGSGNMSLINAPSVNWSNKIDPYDPKVKDTINKQTVPFSGKKTFNIPFSISEPGKYSIPPIYFSWFDPKSGQYQTAKTEPIYFQVTAGKGIQKFAGKTFARFGWLMNISKAEWISGIALLAGILILILFFFIRKRKKENELETLIKLDDLKNEQAEEFVIPGNPLAEVHEKLTGGDADGFYHELKTSIQKYLSGRLKIPMYELTKERICQRLDECNVSIGTTKLLESLMQEIELGLYAKHSHPGQMRALYEKTAELVSLLNKQIC